LKKRIKKILIGRKDIVDFPQLDLWGIEIKIDSGACTSSFHCHNIKEEKGVLRCQFLDPDHEKTEITVPNKEKPAIIIKNSKWLRAKHSGIYRSYVSAGQRVEKGAQLGSISDPFGNFEEFFKNPQAGYVLNSNHTPVVNQGDALFHIGFE